MIRVLSTLYARQNETFRASVFVQDETGAAIDVTGWTFKMQARRAGDDPASPSLDLSTVSTDVEGVRVMDAAGGELAIKVPHTTLAAIPDTTGRFEMSYDVQGIKPDGDRVIVDAGTMVVEAGVTQ